MPRNEVLQTLSELKIGCANYPEGDPIKAIVFIRDEQVAQCMRTQNKKEYDKFAKLMKKNHQYTDEGRNFVKNGFPSTLIPAATLCDATILKDYDVGYRRAFAITNYGWDWR